MPVKRAGDEAITIRGARVHNLQGVDCDLPRHRLTVITGPSGSGKSSLAFDTLYAEGQRRYVESLSPYARQFLEQLEKPEVESVTGLSPAIAIDQRTNISHPRSTVGTVTEVYDHLRVLFAALGRPHCPRCAREISAQTVEQMAEQLFDSAPGAPIAVLAPVVRGRKGAFRRGLQDLAARGYVRARVDGRACDLRQPLTLDPRRNHRIEVLVERLILRDGAQKRLVQSLDKALHLASGVALILQEGGRERLLSQLRACADCGLSVPELSPRAFSFNSPYGACPGCDGLGVRWQVDPRRVLPEDDRSVADGAIHPWQRHGPRLVREALQDVAARHGFSLDAPLRELSKKSRHVLLHGDGDGFAGVLPSLSRRVDAALRLAGAEPAAGADREAADVFDELRPYLTEVVCKECSGARLRKESLAVRLLGRGIAELVRLPINEAVPVFDALQFEERAAPVADRLLGGIRERLRLLEAVGVGYLSLDRATTTLSGGEARRIRLAGQIGARMQGLLYVLDEPSVGLHPRDNERLLDTLRQIRDLGNTVVVVEHDEQTIRAADYLIDLGEGAGSRGGRIMYQGPPSSLDGSLTGRYLRGELSIPVPPRRRAPQGVLRIQGAREHNLRDLDVSFPLGVLTAVTGVSGSGKSTLVDDILHRALARRLNGGRPSPAGIARSRAEAIDKVIAIDQSLDRPHAAQQPRDLYRRLRVRARDAQPGAGGQDPRVPAGTLLVQRPRRPVRELRRGRADQDRDALPSRRVRHVRGVQGSALQPRDARGPLPRAHHRGRAGPLGVGGAAGAGGAPAPVPPPAHPGRRGPGLPAPGPERVHALGRRGAAREAGEGALPPRHRPHALHPGRAHHRPALRRRAQAAARAGPAGGRGQHRGGGRAQPGRDQVRRPRHRPRARRRTRRRPAGGGRHAGGGRRLRAERDRSPPGPPAARGLGGVTAPDWRALFPVASSTTYLVSHSLGAMPRTAAEQLAGYAETWAERGVRAWSEGWWDLPRTLGDEVGRQIGAPTGSVVMQPNVSIAQAAVASCLDFGTRRNTVVFEAAQFPSVGYVWEAQRALGARIRTVASPDGITVPLERFLEALDEETLVVPLSHALFRSGFVQDVAAITRRAHEVGALVVADLYQSAGTVPVDVTAWDVDFAVGGCLKWLCGGPGAAFLYVAPRLHERFAPRVTGWAADQEPFAFRTGPIEYAKGAARFLQGTPAVPALYAARAGLAVVERIGVPAIRRQSVAQMQLLIDLAQEAGFRVRSPARAEERGGLAVIEAPAAWAEELLRRDVLVDHRPDAGIRVSTHFYTSDDDVHRLISELRSIRDAPGGPA
jgi:excinuclease ABC subunit A